MIPIEIIEKMGGTLSVAYHLNLNQKTVDTWTKTGIPGKHWKALISLAGDWLTPEMIMEANEKVEK